MIIDGKKEAERLCEKLKEKATELIEKYEDIPCVAIILVGNNEASQIYVKNKINKAKEIGIKVKLISLKPEVIEEELSAIITQLNADNEVHGIIVQMPLPLHINTYSILEKINPNKDVDGFHPINMGYLYLGSDKGFVPSTPLGCMHLLNAYVGDITGLKGVVIGRSIIVGRPLAMLLLHRNCTVTICHSHTVNLEQITKNADIVITCVGKPKMFGREFFNSSSIIIDVGITRSNGIICGDVDFNSVSEYVKYITPVPRGVGPMTVAYLMSNVLKAFEKNN